MVAVRVTAADQGHLAEGVSFAKPRNWARVFAGIREHVHLPFGNDVKRVARIAGMKQNFAGLEMALADIGQNALDAFRRKMPQQIAFRQQLDQLARFLLLALQRIFVKMRRHSEPPRLAFRDRSSRRNRSSRQVRNRRR